MAKPRDVDERGQSWSRDLRKQIRRIESSVEALPQLAEDAAAFFGEQDRRLKRVEKLVEMLAAKSGATPEELAAVAAAVKDLDATTAALQGAVDRSNQSPEPTKE